MWCAFTRGYRGERGDLSELVAVKGPLDAFAETDGFGFGGKAQSVFIAGKPTEECLDNVVDGVALLLHFRSY